MAPGAAAQAGRDSPNWYDVQGGEDVLGGGHPVRTGNADGH